MGKAGSLKPEGASQAAGRVQETQPQAGRAVGQRMLRSEEKGRLELGAR